MIFVKSKLPLSQNKVGSIEPFIIATINQRTCETKRPIKESYESEKSRRIVFDDELPKWNYLIKCS